MARFDVVTNIGEQTKPSEFGERSLDPFFIQEDTTPFKFDIDSGTGERDFFLANTVSITVGDYGEDEDKIVLQAFSNTDVLLGEATATLPASETDFTLQRSLLLVSMENKLITSNLSVALLSFLILSSMTILL